MNPLSHPQDVLQKLCEEGEPAALVIVVDINGGTLRSKGALMAVTPDEVFGYISAGCVDADIIFQARAALEDKQDRSLLYGEGSPFKDIQLPCGGAIEIYISVNHDIDQIKQSTKKLTARQAATLKVGPLQLPYIPKLKLRIVGRGTPFATLCDLAFVSGYLVHGQSPEKPDQLSGFSQFDHLKSLDNPPALEDDPWTAVIFLFHDHDWEPALLRQALSGDAFYIGAMGSDRTHQQRINRLQSMGVSKTDRIKGPIGLIPAMRDAQRLAISILAEVIVEAQTQSRLS